MSVRFHKMHGLGNDFVVIDGRETPVALDNGQVRAIADRRTGVGCDQLIVIERSSVADAKMRIFNADGGEVEACGNATRCVARLLGEDVRIETMAGILHGTTDALGATVDMGAPRFDWQTIPLSYAMDTRDMPVGWDAGLERPTAVNVGNPHVIFFVPDTDAVPLDQVGPVVETDPLFPDRINVNVATIVDRSHIRLRVWERGVGLTQACGTGACATAVAAIRLGLADGPVTVTLPGGDLIIDWRDGETIRMTGPATHVFTGELDADAL
ncbi:diaminopimelate epimerase [Sphingomonas sp. C3-2]|uniref:diaminopimelate epimerase n=1 Tax=Sphingomonas sp. C3-2 TaxID=3062169 RepID=UPI00294AB033|nr:diaminopimelate epimerase [Sphingomonas sp. C3-2]WOK37033.1 diaminopimelate epimerase [Sphingomonas sp. C3-2]